MLSLLLLWELLLEVALVLVLVGCTTYIMMCRRDQARGVIAAKKEREFLLAESSRQIEQVKREAAQANERAARVELELEKFKKRARWRSVSAEQEAKIGAALKNAERGAIEVRWAEDADDGEAFAEQLFAVLEKVGGYAATRTSHGVAVAFHGKPLTGLVIETNRLENKVALGIQNALDVGGIEALAKLNEGQKEDVVLMVFRKP